jgi:D-arabinose 1-dehydrogenase-like Zn-dependent alcohol dehydrogenase
LSGRDNLCPQAEKYGRSNLDQGSFGMYAVWKASFVFKLPSTISLENAAPLMCGGATVFHVLKSSNVKVSDRVGVIGIGGLGHLAIQFAAKMGCEVVAFSSTDNKKEEAMRLGATQFVATAGVKTLDIGEPLDHLLVTTSFQPDWDLYLDIMAPQGSIYPVTVSEHNLSISSDAVIDKELRIMGSLVAPRQVYREMIDFTALHNIKPIIETFPMTANGITEAMDRLRAGKMRYRGVLVV